MQPVPANGEKKEDKNGNIIVSGWLLTLVVPTPCNITKTVGKDPGSASCFQLAYDVGGW